MKNVLITGGEGFIGRNLTEQLKGTCNVSGFSSSKLNMLDKTAVLSCLKKGRFDCVIHTAWWSTTRNSNKDVALALSNNLKMFDNLKEGQDLFGKMIYYGSGSEYNREFYIPKMKEEYFGEHIPDKNQIDSNFSKYKITLEALKSKNITNLRAFAVFGKYEDWEIRFISNSICKVIFDLPISIKQNVKYDYIHVDDVVAVTRWFIENNAGDKVYNLCTGTVHDLVSLAKTIIKISGKKLDIIVKKEGMGKEYSGDNTRLLKEIGDYRFSKIEEDIEKLYNWYRSIKEKIDIKRLLIDK